MGPLCPGKMHTIQKWTEATYGTLICKYSGYYDGWWDTSMNHQGAVHVATGFTLPWVCKPVSGLLPTHVPGSNITMSTDYPNNSNMLYSTWRSTTLETTAYLFVLWEILTAHHCVDTQRLSLHTTMLTPGDSLNKDLNFPLFSIPKSLISKERQREPESHPSPALLLPPAVIDWVCNPQFCEHAHTPALPRNLPQLN